MITLHFQLLDKNGSVLNRFCKDYSEGIDGLILLQNIQTIIRRYRNYPDYHACKVVAFRSSLSRDCEVYFDNLFVYKKHSNYGNIKQNSFFVG